MSNLNVFKYYSEIRPIYRLKYLPKKLKFAYQRITKGYCDMDVWNLESFYTLLFYDSLNELAETTHSYPYDFQTPELWSQTLKEMAEHFYNASADHNDIPLAIAATEAFDKFRNDELNREEWLEKEKELSNFRESEKNKGLDMLKQYFFDLWD